MQRFPKIKMLTFLAFVLGTLLGDSVEPRTRVLARSNDDPAIGHASASQETQKATLKPAGATAPDIPVDPADASAEQTLLTLANQSRRQAGAPPLTFDPGLAQAARIHAQAMLHAQQLSHQFDGEPSLPQRLAAT